HIQKARELGAKSMILEVIKDNLPAYSLFTQLGFRDTRVLLILRRPPGELKVDVGHYKATFLESDEVVSLLAQRRSIPSWLDETPSLLNAGNLGALRVELANGGRGWMVYQSSIFQLSRL